MKLRSIIQVVFAVFLLSARIGCGETYRIESSNSSIAFSVHQFFSATKGKFKQFGGTVVVDRDQPEHSSVTARIEVRSIDTGIHKRDEHLLSPEFFDAARFPEILFKSRNARPTGPQTGDINGDLAMHGLTRPIVLHVQLLTPLRNDEKVEHTRWRVTTDPLKRSDFNLLFNGTAEAVSGISQDVLPRIEIVASRTD